MWLFILATAKSQSCFSLWDEQGWASDPGVKSDKDVLDGITWDYQVNYLNIIKYCKQGTRFGGMRAIVQPFFNNQFQAKVGDLKFHGVENDDCELLRLGKDDDIHLVEIYSNSIRITKVLIETHEGTTLEIGGSDPNDEKIVYDFDQIHDRYRVFGFYSLVNSPAFYLKNLGLVMYDRACSLNQNLPTRPQNFRLNEDPNATNRLQITLEWDAWVDKGGEPTSYEIQIAQQGSNSFSTYRIVTGTSIVINDQVTGAELRFQVRAKNLFGDSPYTAVLTVTQAFTPRKVSNVATETLSTYSGIPADDAVRVTWSEPANGGSPITGYRVFVADDTGEYHQTSCSGVATQCDIKYSELNGTPFNINWGKSVTATVYADNSRGASEVSDSGTGAVIYTAPSAIQGVKRDSTKSRIASSLYITWSLPADDQARGGKAESDMNYAIFYNQKDDPNSRARIKVIEDGSQNTYEITAKNSFNIGLQLGVEYEILVYATNQLGIRSPASAPEYIKHALVPAKPRDLSTSNNEANLEISWLRSASNGEIVSEYKIYIRYSDGNYGDALPSSLCDGKSSDNLAENSDPRKCSFKILELQKSPYNLQKDNEIWVKIEASNSIGQGASEEGNGAVMKAVPSSPQKFETDETAPTDQKISFSWQAPDDDGGSPILTYSVYDGSSDALLQADIPSSQLSFETTNSLTLKQDYTFKTTATNVLGESAKSVLFTVRSAKRPEAPTEVVKDDQNSNAQQIGLTWTIPDNNGADITDYVVWSNKADPNSSNLLEIATVQTASYIMTGLIGGQNYIFEVEAKNIKGTSDRSISKTILAAQEPQPPTEAYVSYDRPLNLMAEWKKPTDNGGQPIIGYEVFVQNFDTFSEFFLITCDFVNPTDSTCKFKQELLLGSPYNLKYGDPFRVQVTAVNDIGASAKSLNAINKEFPPSELLVLTREPDAPVNLQNDNTLSTATEAVLKYEEGDEDGGAPVKSFNILMEKDGIFESLGTTDKTQFTITGLVKGTTYRIKVQAISTSGTSPDSQVFELTFEPVLKPDPPYALAEVVAETNRDQITVEWQAPEENGGAEVTQYRVFFGLVGEAAIHELTPTSETKYVITTGLVAGETYEIKVQSRNSRGFSGPTQIITVIAASVPEAPQFLANVPTLTNAKQVGLEWQAPDDGGSEILEYRIYRVNPPTEDLVDVTHSGLTVTNHIEKPLVQGVTYKFAVEAYNTKGWSLKSNEIEVLAAQKPFAPSKPVAVFDLPTLSYEFTWEKPNTGGSEITAYTLYIRQVDEETFSTVVCDTPAEEKCTVPATTLLAEPFKLLWGAQVFSQVSATNVYDESEKSELDLDAPLMLRTPDAPIKVVQTEITQSSLTFTFQDGEESGGSPVLSHRVKQAVKGGAFVVIHEEILMPALEFIASSLTPEETYQFTVEAYNAQGFGTPSEVKEVFFDPLLPPNPPEKLKEVRENTLATQIGLSWTEAAIVNGPVVLDYAVWQKITGSVEDFVEVEAGIIPTNYIVKSLVQGTSYDFKVLARNEDGVSELSESVTILAAQFPAQLLKPTIEFLYPSYIFKWEAPTDNGGSPVTGYKVKMFNSLDAAFTPTVDSDCTASVTSTAVECKIEAESLFSAPFNLVTKDKFTIQVTAMNLYGDSPISAASDAQTVFNKPDAPQKAVNNEDKTSNDQIFITWEAGDSDGGLPITSFTAEIYEDAQLLQLLDSVTITTVDVKEADFAGLTTGQTYFITVKATNAFGTSAQSTVASIIAENLKFPPEAPVASNDEEFTSSTQIGLKWTEPADGGASIIDYQVLWKLPTETDFQILKSGVTENKLLITEFSQATADQIKAGKSYDFQVRAQNKKGYGPASATVTIEASGRPLPPTSVTISFDRETTSATIKWELGFDNAAPLTSSTVYVEKKDKSAFEAVTCDTTTDTSCKIQYSLLESDFQYELGDTISARVSASNKNGESSPSVPAERLYALNPLAPVLQNDDLVSSDSQIGLKWSSPNMQGSPLVDYKIYWKKTSESNYQLLKEGLTDNEFKFTEFQVGASTEPITAGASYDFYIQASNDEGLSAQSNSVSIVASAGPSAPTGVSIQLDKSNRLADIKVTWIKPETNGAILTGYEVKYQEKDSQNFVPAPCVFQTKTDVTCNIVLSTLISASGMQLGDTLKVHVIAQSRDNGNSPPSLAAEKLLAFTPPPPQNFANDPDITSNTQIGLNWDAPIDNGGSEIQFYSILYTDDQSSGYTTTAQINQGTSLTITEWIGQKPIVPGTDYYIKIAAFNDIGFGDYAYIIIKASSAPDAPTNVNVEIKESAEDKVTITWVGSQPNGATLESYKVFAKDSSASDYSEVQCIDTTPLLLTCDILVSTLQDSPLNLQLGSTISVKVKVTTSDGSGDSALSDADTTLFALSPVKPTEVETDSEVTSSTRIGLHWQVPSDTRGSPIIDYQVWWKKPDETEYKLQEEGLTETKLTITQFKPDNEAVGPGELYDFTVRARNEIGLGAFSTASTIRAVSTPTAPGSPSIALDREQDTVTVSWQESNGNGGTLESYTVKVQDSLGNAYEKDTCIFEQPLDTTCVIVLADLKAAPFNLKLGDQLKFEVLASSEFGDSSATHDEVLLAFKPRAVSNVEKVLAETSKSQITVTWTKPNDEQGAAVDNYKVLYKGATDVAYTSAGETSDTKLTVTGLTSGQLYTFKVQAHNSQGWGDESVPIEFAASGVPAKPVISSLQYDQVNKWYTLEWNTVDDNGSEQTGYKVFAKNKNEDFKITDCTKTSETSCTILISTFLATPFNLELSDETIVKVIITNSEGDSAESEPISTTLYMVPDAPVITRKDRDVRGKITISWVDGPSNGGSDITHYRLAYKKPDDASETVLNNRVTEKEYSTLSGFDLVLGDEYIFYVTAVNDQFESETSSLRLFYSFKPDAPEQVSTIESEIDHESVQLSWQAGEDNGGAQVTQYIVSYSIDGSQAVQQQNFDTKSITLKGLQEKTTYNIQVQAENAVGLSAKSTQITITTQPKPVEPKTDNTILIVVIVVVLIVLVLIIVAIIGYCICKKKNKKKVEVDRGEIRGSTDEENPEIVDSSKNLLNDSQKDKIQDPRMSTGDLDFQCDLSQHRLTTVHNEQAELMAECPEDPDEESLRNSQRDIDLKSVQTLASPKQQSIVLGSPRGDIPEDMIKPRLSVQDSIDTEQTGQARMSMKLGGEESNDDQIISEHESINRFLEKEADVEMPNLTGDPFMKDVDEDRLPSQRSHDDMNETIAQPEVNASVLTEVYNENVALQGDKSLSAQAIEVGEKEIEKQPLPLFPADMPIPSAEEIKFTERSMVGDKLLKRPTLSPEMQIHASAPIIQSSDSPQLKPDEASNEYDPKFDPNYTKKFHKLKSDESNMQKVQQSLYDEEAKEVPSSIPKRYNEIVNNNEDDVLPKPNEPEETGDELPLSQNYTTDNIEVQDRYVINNNMVSLVDEPPKAKLKLKKKKTKKASPKKQTAPRTIWSASDHDRAISGLHENEPPLEDQPQQQVNADPESEEILMMIQNLWEKKALGCLSKLDKKLLAKLNKLVADNPKHYSGKIGYLQMIYQ